MFSVSLYLRAAVMDKSAEDANRKNGREDLTNTNRQGRQSKTFKKDLLGSPWVVDLSQNRSSGTVHGTA